MTSNSRREENTCPTFLIEYYHRKKCHIVKEYKWLGRDTNINGACFDKITYFLEVKGN